MNELHESKKIYYHQYFEKDKSNMKKLWKGINSTASSRFDNLDTISFVPE